jgi:hypothetical protein
MTRQRGETITTGYARVPLELETLTLSVFGRKSQVLQCLLNDALAAIEAEASEELTVYALSNSWHQGWEIVLKRQPRPLDVRPAACAA